MPTTRLAIAASVLLLAVACDGGPATITPHPAMLRVTHATPSLGAIDLLVDGSPVVSGLAYGTSSGLVAAPAGPQDVVVRAGGQTVGTIHHALIADRINSVVISDSAPQFSDSVVSDTGQPAPTRANIRLVNVVGSNLSAPTALQVLIHAPNANPDSVVTSNLDATISAYWSLMYFDPGTFDIRYVAVGDTTTLAQVTFDVAAGEKKAVVLQRAANGSYSAAVSVEP